MRDFPFEVFLDYKRPYRYTERCSPSGVFHIDAYGDFRVVIGCKAYEGRMVASVRILGRTCLSTHFYVGKIGQTACAACDRHTHPFGNIVEIGLGYCRYAACTVFFVNHRILYFFDHMWRYEPSSVGHCCTEVGNLQRGGKDFALAY